MANQELINYINESKEKGFSLDDIRKALIDVGWDERDIEEAIDFTLQKPKSGKKFSFKSILIGIIIALIIGLVVWGVYLYLEGHRQPTEKEAGKETEQEKEEPKEVVPENWTTYTNKEYGYQIDYPADWVIIEEEPHSTTSIGNIPFVETLHRLEIQTFSNEKLAKRPHGLLPKKCIGYEDCLYVAVEVKSGIPSLEQWKNEKGKTYRESALPWEIQEGKIRIGEREGYELITWLAGSSLSSSNHRVAFFKDGKLYEINAEGKDIKVLFETFPKTLERIISSFRFIGEQAQQKIEREKDISSLQQETIQFETIKERDDKRSSDIMTIALLLDNYHEKKGIYPEVIGCKNIWSTSLIDELLSIPLGDIDMPMGNKEDFPKDPINSGEYVYKYSSDGKDYVLWALFENPTDFEDPTNWWLEGDADGDILDCACDDPAFCWYSVMMKEMEE